MVTAFEQSLSAMTSRLQQLTSMSERKDAELNRLRTMIDEIAYHNGSGKKRDTNDLGEGSPGKKGEKKSKEKKSSLLIRRHTFASVTSDGKSSIIDHLVLFNMID